MYIYFIFILWEVERPVQIKERQRRVSFVLGYYITFINITGTNVQFSNT